MKTIILGTVIAISAITHSIVSVSGHWRFSRTFYHIGDEYFMDLPMGMQCAQDPGNYCTIIFIGIGLPDTPFYESDIPSSFLYDALKFGANQSNQ